MKNIPDVHVSLRLINIHKGNAFTSENHADDFLENYLFMMIRPTQYIARILCLESKNLAPCFKGICWALFKPIKVYTTFQKKNVNQVINGMCPKNL